MNKAIISGRLTKDPEIRYTQSAEPLAIARYTIAANRRFKKEGEPDADFINCVSFGKSAEFLEKYFKKGMMIAVSGRIQVRSYEDNTGQRRWVTEVITDEVEFGESRGAYEARMSQGGHDFAGGEQPTTGGYPDRDERSYSERSYAERSYPDKNYTDKSYPERNVSAGKQPYEPEGFSAITDSIDEDDLPF